MTLSIPIKEAKQELSNRRKNEVLQEIVKEYPVEIGKEARTRLGGG